MSKREYDPKRRAGLGADGEKKIPPDRVAWVQADWLTVIQYRAPDTGERPTTADEVNDPELIEQYGLIHMLMLQAGRNKLWLNLSKFTVPELDAIKEVIDRVFGEARTECEIRDAKAQEAYEDGDYSSSRLYRPVPQVVYRPGEKRQHD